MILLAWSCLIVAFVEKAAGFALATRPYFLGMSPFDWVLMGGVLLLFALALAARLFWFGSHRPVSTSKAYSVRRAPVAHALRYPAETK
jgi:hypothetical protein